MEKDVPRLNYSINLFCINNTIDPTDIYIFKKDFKDHFARALQRWSSGNPNAEVNLWYDSTYTTKEAIKKTADLLIDQNSINNIFLKDIRDLPVVKNNPDIFSKHTTLYFQSHFLRLIVCLHSIVNCKMSAAIYAHPGMGLEYETNETQLFNPSCMSLLKESGILLERQSEYKYEFIQIINAPEIIDAITHTINSFILMASNALNTQLVNNEDRSNSNFMYYFCKKEFFNDIFKKMWQYLYSKKFLPEIKIKANIVKTGNETQLVTYDPHKHKYVAFGNIYSFRSDSNCWYIDDLNPAVRTVTTYSERMTNMPYYNDSNLIAWRDKFIRNDMLNGELPFTDVEYSYSCLSRLLPISNKVNYTLLAPFPTQKLQYFVSQYIFNQENFFGEEEIEAAKTIRDRLFKRKEQKIILR